MKILQISVNDFGGCGYYLAEALKAAGHESMSIRQSAGSYIRYPSHLVLAHPDHLVGVWNWADVVHVHDVMPSLPPECKTKPTVITYHGSMYRRNPKLYNDFIKRFGWVGTVSTIDLTAGGLPWMPDTRPEMQKYVDKPAGRFIVAHAPTSRKVKNTEEIIGALDGVPDIALDVIEGQPYEDCLKRKGRASLYVDQFKLCYGLNTIEAWQMGMPAIANAQTETIERIESIIGFVPFVRCEVGDLRQTVLGLKGNKKAYAEAVERGKRCVEMFHSYQAAAKAAVEFYERALSVGAPKQQPQAGKYTPQKLAGANGMTKVRYIGGNWGSETHIGSVSGTSYVFSKKDPIRWVDERDVHGLLHPSGKQNAKDRGKTEFEVIK